MNTDPIQKAIVARGVESEKLAGAIIELAGCLKDYQSGPGVPGTLKSRTASALQNYNALYPLVKHRAAKIISARASELSQSNLVPAREHCKLCDSDIYDRFCVNNDCHFHCYFQSSELPLLRVCSDCGGEGVLTCDGKRHMSPHNGGIEIPCVTCQGTGKEAVTPEYFSGRDAYFKDKTLKDNPHPVGQLHEDWYHGFCAASDEPSSGPTLEDASAVSLRYKGEIDGHHVSMVVMRKEIVAQQIEISRLTLLCNENAALAVERDAENARKDAVIEEASQCIDHSMLNRAAFLFNLLPEHQKANAEEARKSLYASYDFLARLAQKGKS